MDHQALSLFALLGYYVDLLLKPIPHEDSWGRRSLVHRRRRV